MGRRIGELPRRARSMQVGLTLSEFHAAQGSWDPEKQSLLQKYLNTL